MAILPKDSQWAMTAMDKTVNLVNFSIQVTFRKHLGK